MKDILIASHGRLAEGLKNTLSIFSGDLSRVKVSCAYVDDSIDYLNTIKEFIANSEDGNSVIFTDIYGGSVNTQIIEEIVKSQKDIPVVAGMNLPLVLSILVSDEKITIDYLKHVAEECKPNVVEIELKPNDEVSKGDEEDDFLN